MTLRNYTSAERKEIPMWSVLAQYFPDAFAALARHAKKANDKHNPGEPMHWAREKSKDHLECAVRHLATPFEVDPDTNEVELVGAFWRIGAELQLFEEKRLAAAGIRPLSGVVPSESGSVHYHMTELTGVMGPRQYERKVPCSRCDWGHGTPKALYRVVQK